MAAELDHIFICTAVGAPAADQLIQFGLTEGPSNVHAGQGTANRRFFFRNAYLELLWVRDPAEAQTEAVRSTCLWERWAGRESRTSPFGLCFRAVEGESPKPPFATWDYRPQYLPPPMSIGIATNVEETAEPFLCHLTFARRPDSLVSEVPSRRHAAGMRQITSVEVVTPRNSSYSPALQAVIDLGLVTMRIGAEHLLEIEFDGESQRRRADFRPGLPLIFSW